MSENRKEMAGDGDDSSIKRLMELPESTRRLVVIMMILKLPEEKRNELITPIAESIREKAYAIEKEATSYASDISIIADLMQDRQIERGEASEAERLLQECCDEGLAFLMRDLHGLGRAARSESRELTCTACGAMHETSAFLRALRRDLEISENEAERQDILRYFSHHVYLQTEALSELINKYPDAAKGIGEDYPNWPLLMFRRNNLPADYRRQADLIGLGDTCAVNPSPRVNWNSLQKYLSTIFWEWQDAKRFMEYKPMKGDDRTDTQRLKVCLADYPQRPEDSITDTEAKLFLESFKLLPLTEERESRRQWTESFIIPLIDLREPELEAVPAFKMWLESDNMKVRDRKGMLVAIKEGVIRALETMVR